MTIQRQVEEDNLAIGLGTEISLQFDRIMRRIDGVFVGMSRGECLIVQVDTSVFDRMNSGYLWRSEVIGRYLHNGRVVGFKAKFLEVISFPIKAVFISYPEKLESIDLRRHPRTDCYLPARITHRGREWEAHILDISEGGCRCSVKDYPDPQEVELSVEDQVVLNTHLLGDEHAHEFQAEIRSMEDGGEEKERLLGLRFRQISAEDRGCVLQFILNVDSEIREQSYRDFEQWKARRLQRDVMAVYLHRFHTAVESDSGIREVTLFAALGLDFEGRRELLDEVVESRGDDAKGWQRLLQRLEERGVERCLFAISGDDPGVCQAIAAVFPASDHQLSFQGLMDKARRTARPEDHLVEELEELRQEASFLTGLDRLNDLVAKYRLSNPEMSNELQERAFQYLMFLNLPVEIRSEFADVSLLDSLFSILDGFRKSVGGHFASESDLLSKGFWASWRMQYEWREPIGSIVSNREKIAERFETVFMDRPRGIEMTNIDRAD